MNIFVGNLTDKATEDELQIMFGKFGKVKSVKIIADMFTGVKKGFAFVEMYSDNESQKAIDELNLTELDGKMIMVNKARPPKKRRR